MPGDLQWVMDAFYRLSASRQVGMSVGPIPFEAVDAYADRYGIRDGDDFETFHTLLRAADNAYLEAMRDRRDNGSQGPRTPKDDTVERTPDGR